MARPPSVSRMRSRSCLAVGALLLAFLQSPPLAAGSPVADEPEGPPAPEAAVRPPRKPALGWALLDVAAFNVLPNLWSRFVRQKSDSHVTLETWRTNLSRGFAYDPDKFVTNQLSHPQHGGIYYAAARSNGLGLYASGALTFLGSLTWEYFGEITRPSTNDLISTTLGGVSTGETSYRLSDLVLDETATGWNRATHEVLGLLVSPGRSLQRLVSGDAWRVGPAREGVRPAFLTADLLAGGLLVRSTRSTTPTTTKGRATVAMDVRYGDPFEKDLDAPFSSFGLSAEVNTGKQPFVTRVQSEGVLAGWRLDDGPERSFLAATFGFNYVDVDLEWGGETLGLALASRFALGSGWELVAEGEGLTSFSSIQTSEESVPSTYRNYDWGLGGGLGGRLRLRRKGRDVLLLDATDLWLSTTNGPTVWNQVQLCRVGGRVPVSRTLAVGLEGVYQRHLNVFPDHRESRSSRQLRLQVVWNLFTGAP